MKTFKIHTFFTSLVQMSHTSHFYSMNNNGIKSLVMILIMFYTITTMGQNFGECGTFIDTTNVYQPSRSFDNSSDTWLYKYRTPGYWIPNSTTPIKTILVNWVICRDDNGGNGWQDSQAFRNEVNRMFDSINLVYSTSLPKGYTLTCEPQYTHIYDTRIRFELNDIIFIDNTLFNQCELNDYYLVQSIVNYVKSNYPSSSKALTHIFTQPPYNPEEPAWGKYGTCNDYNDSYVITKRSMWDTTIVVWSNHIAHITHEYGHAVGLGDTSYSEITCLSHFDFLNDVYGDCSENVSPCEHWVTPCDGIHVCWLPKTWFEDNFDPSYPLMSNSMINSRYISPKSMGRMHRALSLYDNVFVVQNQPMHKYVKEKYSYIYPLTINTNETWDFAIKMYQDIVVTNDATLTITGEVRMPIDGKIIIQPGAKLIIDGGRITSAHDQQWSGIEVWGNYYTHQVASHGHYNQGFLELKNGAVIENAKCAVELWRPDHWSTTGGIIHATDATFRNNAMAVRALCYTNYHPYSHLQLSYDAYFDNCSFVIDNNYLGTYNFEKHVVLLEVNGISFTDCNFSANRNVSGVHPWCIGISAYDAGFAVASNCPASTNPCSDHSTFTGLCSGIYASGTGTNPHAFTVRDAIFNNNDYGIHVLNSNYPTILFNEFKIGGGGYCDYNYGVCLENCTGFCVEENYFHPTSKTASYTIGIAIYNSNGINDVYRNTFEDLFRADLAFGQNTTGSTGALQGLTYTCNEFSGNQRDIMVLKKNGVGDIQSQQGSSATPAGNTFESSTFQIYNDGTTPMDYYYNSTESDETPNTTMLYRVTRHGTTSANSCVSHYGNTPIVKSPSEKAALASDYLSAYNAYMNLRQQYESHIDDSDTENPTADNSPTSAEMLQLSAEMAQYGHEFTLAAGDIVRSNLNDSVANPTELRTWLRNMNDIAADRMAISSYIQEGDSSSAFALARTLPSLYDLQGDQLADHNDYMRLISLYQALRSSGRNIFQLTETETNMVRDMAANGMGVSQSMARSLMEQITGRSGDACLDLKLPGLRSGDKGGMTYSNTVESEKNGMNVSVGPNPATTWTTVNYTLPDNGTKALLTLTNSMGVNVLTMELEGAQGNKVLDLRGFAAGVYVYTVRYEQYTEIGKLVITK